MVVSFAAGFYNSLTQRSESGDWTREPDQRSWGHSKAPEAIEAIICFCSCSLLRQSMGLDQETSEVHQMLLQGEALVHMAAASSPQLS